MQQGQLKRIKKERIYIEKCIDANIDRSDQVDSTDMENKYDKNGGFIL